MISKNNRTTKQTGRGPEFLLKLFYIFCSVFIATSVQLIAVNALATETVTDIPRRYEIPKEEMLSTSDRTSSPAYYLTVFGMKRHFIMDENGQKTSKFMDSFIKQDKKMSLQELWAQLASEGWDLAGTMDVTSHLISEEGAIYILSRKKQYTLIIESDGTPVCVELYFGFGTITSAPFILRYSDLVLSAGQKAQLTITPQGVSPLILDEDNNGDFEKYLAPTAVMIGKEQIDAIDPEITFNTQKKGDMIVVTLLTTDNKSGVKQVWYSFDPVKENTKIRYQPYAGPFEVNPKQVQTITVMADDHAGNRKLKRFKVQ